jgi:hypothetical protein
MLLKKHIGVPLILFYDVNMNVLNRKENNGIGNKEYGPYTNKLK